MKIRHQECSGAPEKRHSRDLQDTHEVSFLTIMAHMLVLQRAFLPRPLDGVPSGDRISASSICHFQINLFLKTKGLK